ncbi:MAG: aldehyde ferredoxin oxidoreductase C-terminal domain-containing protein [Dethiobacter sp.]|jgi:aldehyde:ferredoxin oxidoreductase|nr:aldehyde ferredoxin oxidoreductase C-terminal domain-containing protein [Dethiobacter sp.]
MDAFNSIGNIPTRNFRDGFFEDINNISAITLSEIIGYKMEGCSTCPVRCKKAVICSEMDINDSSYGGPEYETLASFGANCGVNDLKAIIAANAICNGNSIDTISAGVTIGFAMECFEKGILTLNDTGGIKLEFGNSEAMLQVLELIAKRQDIGDLLADGVLRAANTLGQGSDSFAVHVKGLEMGMHEPRLKQGLGLGYAVASLGADHNTGLHDTRYVSKSADLEEIKALGFMNPIPVNDLGPRKVSLFAALHRWNNFQDCLVKCIFVPFNFSKTVRAVSAITGWDTTVYEAMKVGERAIQLARIFNIREGFSAKEDNLPPRIHTPMPGGHLKGSHIAQSDLRQGIMLYYEEMGWTKDGIPKKSTLEKLEIEWASECLENL